MERYRIHSDGAVYFVTYSVVDWLPVFVGEASCRIVTDSLTFCHHHKHLRINAYVIMPTHVHTVVFDAAFDSERLRRTLADLRKFTGRKLADWCAAHAPACFQGVFRDAAGEDRDRRVWQPTRHAEAIETERFWQQKFDYVHENPCRKGLVIRAQDWRFSSAAYWISDGASRSDVPLTAIAW